LSSTIEGARQVGHGSFTPVKQPQRGSSSQPQKASTQRTGTGRCDDTVQENCVVGDSQAAECKEFLASSDAANSWPTATAADAQIKCRDERGRLMKIASLSDLARLGADVKYDGHMVALDLFGPDGVTAGTDWNSYDEVADAEVWAASEPSSGGTEQCANVISNPSVNTFVNYLTGDTDCTVASNFICERHVQTTLMACNHWMCPIVGGDVFVDQNFDTTTDMTTLADQTFSFHKLQIDDGSYTDTGNADGNDDGIHTGTVSGNTITITGEGNDGNDWIGKIYKATPGFCVQETLDAYCRYLGLTDWEIVLNESADCEDRSFARFRDNKWGCYTAVGTTDAMECVDDTGAVTVNCPGVDTPDHTCHTDEIHLEMKRLVDEVTECGCKRPDLIEFSAPAQVLTRCTQGCVPAWKWDRPSYANLCEEIGYTKHYDCKLVGTLTVLSTTPSVATYVECATACDNDATCAGINYDEVNLNCELLGPLAEATDFFAKTTDLECTDPDAPDGTGSAPIANDDWIAGRKCKEMSEADALDHTRMMDDLTVRPYICEHCDQHQFTTHEGCVFTGAEIAEADGGLHKHIMTYKDCIALCTANTNCGGVTYYTRHWSAGESGDTGPMYCQLHGTITTDPVCNPLNPYDEVRSGIPCTDEPICVDQLCHTCPTSEWTKEKDCMHSGTLIRTDNGVASYDACRDACIAEDTCELFTWHDTTTMGGPNTAASGDCELFSDDVAMSRLCDPTITKGVLTGRTCQNEERCQMGCGGFNECTGDGVNAASHNCADTAGTSCSDTAGGFTCDHSAASLGIATDGSATYDGHAAGMTTDASGNLVIGGATASISGSTINVANTGATAATHPVLSGTVDASGNIVWSDGTTSIKTDASTTTDTSGTTDTTGTGTTDTTGTGTTGTTGTGTTDTTGTGTTGTTGTGTTDTSGTTGIRLPTSEHLRWNTSLCTSQYQLSTFQFSRSPPQ